MALENIIEQCKGMTDKALIRSLSIDKSEYTDEFYPIAEKELENRGNPLEKAINRVKSRFGERQNAVLTVDESIGKMYDMKQLWETAKFANCLGQTITIQKASLCWAGYVISEEEIFDFLITSDGVMKDILKKFLSLGAWQEAVSGSYDPDDWTMLAGADSLGYVNRLCQNLFLSQIPSSLRVNGDIGKKTCREDACEGDDGPLKIVVRKDHLDAAENALEDLKQFIDGLYEAISNIEEGGDRDKELSLYHQLFELVPNDETVAFNRGVMLYEDGSLLDAADSFIVSAFNRNDPEIRDDSETYLEEILKKMPDNMTILHSLASLAMEKGASDLVEDYYRKIIGINPSDPIAHLNLGHMHYADNSSDDLVKKHFETFLSIDPDADEADEVRRILEELN
ncbi:MAG: hypothetical protein KJ737_09925 [Proteobacteria bacterium]|nr:hypothetical protein [Pseudomonadota bacterium]